MPACHETNRSRSRSPAWSALLFALCCFALAACQPKASTSEASADAETYFPIGFGDSTLHLQLALTQAEQRKGLMFRKELEADHGMLFLSERPRQQGFWMKNTSLPLDIGYLDADGRLVEVHKLFPYDETPVPSRSHEILIAIETNRGWYAKNNILPGAQLDMEALRSAIIARGGVVSSYLTEADAGK